MVGPSEANPLAAMVRIAREEGVRRGLYKGFGLSLFKATAREWPRPRSPERSNEIARDRTRSNETARDRTRSPEMPKVTCARFKVAPSSAVTFVAYEACFRALTRLAESWEREELLRAQLELEAPDTATA